MKYSYFKTLVIFTIYIFLHERYLLYTDKCVFNYFKDQSSQLILGCKTKSNREQKQHKISLVLKQKLSCINKILKSLKEAKKIVILTSI